MIVLRTAGAAASRPASAMGRTLPSAGGGGSVGAKGRGGRRGTAATATALLRGRRRLQVELGIGSVEEVGDSLHGAFSASQEESALGSGQAC